MKKRGQITIFIMLGLIIFLLIMGIFFFKGEWLVKKFGAKSFHSTDFGNDIKNYVENCVRQTGQDAVVFVGNHGGYYTLPEISDAELMLPFFFYQNTNHAISKDELKKQLSDYFREELPFCLQNFYPFEEMGYKVEQGAISADTVLGQDKIFFNVNVPLSVTKETATKQFSSFSAVVPSRLDVVHNLIQQVMAIQQEDPSSICISCITKLAIENDLRVEMESLEDNYNLILFRVVDDKIKINNKPYEFEFVNQYNFNSETNE